MSSAAAMPGMTCACHDCATVRSIHRVHITIICRGEGPKKIDHQYDVYMLAGFTT